jgi:hypothetical protein
MDSSYQAGAYHRLILTHAFETPKLTDFGILILLLKNMGMNHFTLKLDI